MRSNMIKMSRRAAIGAFARDRRRSRRQQRPDRFTHAGCSTPRGAISADPLSFHAWRFRSDDDPRWCHRVGWATSDLRRERRCRRGQGPRGGESATARPDGDWLLARRGQYRCRGRVVRQRQRCGPAARCWTAREHARYSRFSTRPDRRRRPDPFSPRSHRRADGGGRATVSECSLHDELGRIRFLERRGQALRSDRTGCHTHAVERRAARREDRLHRRGRRRCIGDRGD